MSEYENMFTSDDVCIEELSKENTTEETGDGIKRIPYYQYKPDATTGKAKVTVRMLPGIDGDMPIIQEFYHQSPKSSEHPKAKSWCRKLMKGEPCIACQVILESFKVLGKTELQKRIWSDVKSNQKYPKYYFYGVVIIDKNNTNNQGRIFKFGLDSKSASPIILKTKGDVESGINPDPIFSLTKGTNFVIEMYNKDGNNQYDVIFSSPSKLDLKKVNEEDLKLLVPLKESFKEYYTTIEEDVSEFRNWAKNIEEYSETLLPIIDNFSDKYISNKKDTTVPETSPEETKETQRIENKEPVYTKKNKKQEPKTIDDMLNED